MKRFIHLLVCALVAAAMVLPAGAEPVGALWTREEAGGAYVTVRVPFPEGEGMSWGQTRYLGVRYAGTGEPVALTSDYRAGYLFASARVRTCSRFSRPSPSPWRTPRMYRVLADTGSF